MISQDPTFIGRIAKVTGAALSVQMARSIASGLSIIDGRTYKVGQVGSFIRVPQGYLNLFGVVSEVGANEVGANSVDDSTDTKDETGRWLTVELIGESLSGRFDRGISQYPNIGDSVHLAVEGDLRAIYDAPDQDHITIGSLSSAESIPARVALDELVTRHSAVLGSTGSGKSTTVASLLRTITEIRDDESSYPSARILLLDIHGEYAEPLSDVATVFSIEPEFGEEPLFIPFWALDTHALLGFLIGDLDENHETAFTDKINELKLSSYESGEFPGLDATSITVDTPMPFSLKQLWYDLIDTEITTFEGPQRDQPALVARGDPASLTPPTYKLHAMGSAGPFLNQNALGIRRPLNLLRSKMMDRRYDFTLHPGHWDPDDGSLPEKDLDELLQGWIGGSKPITILNLSGVPSGVLEQLVGAILKIVYEALFWSREKTEGGINRPLLIVMEEAHRYLSDASSGLAGEVIERIAKEGRKYGVGAMVVSQRPSEVNETVLSQCGTFFALRLSNPDDRGRVKGTLPDGIAGLLDALPVLRTGEAIVTGEAAKLPMRCRVTLPEQQHRPRSQDPEVSVRWRENLREEGYDRMVASWRAQSPYAVVEEVTIDRQEVEDDSTYD